MVVPFTKAGNTRWSREGGRKIEAELVGAERLLLALEACFQGVIQGGRLCLQVAALRVTSIKTVIEARAVNERK